MNKNNSPQTGQLNVFDSAPVQAIAPLVGVAPVTLNLARVGHNLLHSYLRYGLAVAAFQSKLPEEMPEADLRHALARAIETGLGQFRMRTWDNSVQDAVLKFEPVKLSELREKPHLVQSAGLAAQGIYLYPTLVTTDGGAKDTFKNADEVVALLCGATSLSAPMELSRSFAPTTAKINNGTASQTPPKGTLLEAACAIITTVTPLKPAVWTEQGKTILNTVIIPDLPLVELREFVAVFDGMARQELAASLMHTRSRPISIALIKKAKPSAKATDPPKAAPSEFRRPQLHSGNYPDAPRDANAFGPVGLLAAIGRWAKRTQQQGRGRAVLKSLADQPLHLISYDQINQVRFGHHITRLAMAHDLTRIVDSLYLGTYLYSELDNPGTPFGKPAFKTYCLMASRFLQSFSPATFTDFLTFRAEYALEVEPLFTEYFHTMNPEIVESASNLGSWLNSIAFRVARDETTNSPSAKKTPAQQLKETKAKLLVQLENVVLSAKTPEEMLSQIIIQAGRLAQDDAPAKARRFTDATISEEITYKQAQHLLTAYMRIRRPIKGTEQTILETEATPQTAEPNPQIDNQ